MGGRGLFAPRLALNHRLVYPEQRSDKAGDAHPLRTCPLARIVRAEVLATVAAHIEAVRGDCADVVPYHLVTRAILCSAQYAANFAARSLSTLTVTAACSHAARSVPGASGVDCGVARLPALVVLPILDYSPLCHCDTSICGAAICGRVGATICATARGVGNRST